MSEIIKIGNAEIEKSNYNYFSTLYSKIPKEYVIADLVSKCEEYNRLYKSYEELEVKEMQKDNAIDKALEYIKENIEGNYIRRYEDEIYRDCDELLKILGDKK